MASCYESARIALNPMQTRYESESFTLVAETEEYVKNIFLSSSIKDLSEYRDHAEQALKRAGAVCFPSEEWVASHDDVLQLCHERIGQSQGYIGIFAYYYGSILDGCEESVTHFEFKYANEKWRANQRRPIYVLMPEESSEAHRDLMQRADELKCTEEDQREKHDRLLKLFHDEVKKGRKVNFFKDFYDLREQVIIIGGQLKEFRPLGVATGKIEIQEKTVIQRKVGDEELGLLGRETQLGDLKKIINRLPAFDRVPSVAFIVSGSQTDGQEEFLQQIVRKRRISGRPPGFGRPHSEQYDLDSLIQWMGEILGILDDGNEIKDLKELAALIHAELQSQQLCVILDEIHRYVGAVTAFYETFWTPLFRELEKLQARQPAVNRLIVVIVDYTGKVEHWDSITVKYGDGNLAQEDYYKLFLLQMTDITEDDLLNWFDEVEIPFGTRKHLTNIALKDIEGNPDGTPQQVFRRLRKEDLWKE